MKIKPSLPDSKEESTRAGVVLGYLYLVAVALVVASSIYVVAVAGWTTLYSDQWRIYDTYFTKGLPQGLFAPQNGHRPVLPGLVFLADIHWAGAENRLLNSIGMILALCFCAWWSRVLWKDHELRQATKAFATGSIWLFVFWLGNLRVLGHGNESLHVFPILLCLVAVATTLFRRLGPRQGSGPPDLLGDVRDTLLVLGACLVATLTFGFGVLLWVVAVLITWMIGRDVVRTSILAILTLTMVGLYALVLPGDGAVRQALTLHPLRTTVDAATWLGAPLVRALESYPSIASRIDLMVASGLLGAFGLSLAVGIAARRLTVHRIASPLEAISTALILLGAGCSLLVALARGEYFDRFPGQVVGPRYLPWSSVFWAAVLIFGALKIERLGGSRRLLRSAWMVVCFLVLALLLPSHNGKNFEFKKSKSAEAALGLAVHARHDSMVHNHLFKNPPVVYRVAEVLEDHGWGVFSSPGVPLSSVRLQELYRLREAPPTRVATPPRLEVVPAAGGGSAAHVTCGLNRDFASGLGTQAFVTGEDGRIVGLGSIRGHRHMLARKIGLLAEYPPSVAAYIADYSPNETYVLYVTMDNASAAIPVVTLTSPAER